MGSQRVTQAVVSTQAKADKSQLTEKVAFYNADGTPYDFGDNQTGAEILLTGFVTGAAVTAIAATDTVNAALAKLQNRIAALEA